VAFRIAGWEAEVAGEELSRSGLAKPAADVESHHMRAPRGARLPVHDEEAAREVDDPEVRDARAGVETRLGGPVKGEAGLRDLDDEHGARGDRIGSFAGRALDHGEVRLGTGFVVQVDRQLAADPPASPEGGAKGMIDQLDGERVRIPLRLADNQLPADQLHDLRRAA
jgi:hypothetical protein